MSLTDEQLAGIERRSDRFMARLEGRDPQDAGNAGLVGSLSAVDMPELLAEVRRLRAELAAAGPVIDAAEAWRTWFPHADSMFAPENTLIAAVDARRANAASELVRPAYPHGESQPDIKWVRPFRVAYPNGDRYDGALFPSGRCVLDGPDIGIVTATKAFEHLDLSSAVVEWADGGEAIDRRALTGEQTEGA